MNQLGDKAGWLPKWLDLLLPDVDVKVSPSLAHRRHPRLRPTRRPTLPSPPRR